MPLKITVNETDYFMPEDGAVALAILTDLFQSEKYCELWICAYGFTLQPMFDSIKAADARGVKCHILLDHTQSAGRAEAPLVKALVDSLKVSDVTITTAGLNSGKPSQIWHWKGFVASYKFGEAQKAESFYICWEGSTNFSASAWDQGNSARVFVNDDWAGKFITQQQAHIAWARANEPQYQIGGCS